MKVENATLTINGEPFFFLGADGVPGSVAEMQRHHLNTIFTWGGVPKLLEYADEARRRGFWLMPSFQAPRADLDEVAEEVKSIRSLPNILCWNLGDDLHGGHFAKVKRLAEFIRDLDKMARPLACDAIIHEARIAPLTDLFCLYTYPLLQRPLRWYRRFLEKRRGIELREDQVLWTFPQVHTQTWYARWVHDRPKGQFDLGSYPNAEHVRLIAYEALCAGCKGILFFYWRYLLGPQGKDRFAEVGRLGCELKVLGPLLAAAQRTDGAGTNRPDVHVQQFTGPSARVFLLAMERDDYHFHVDEGLVHNVEIRTPGLASGGPAVWLSPEGSKELPIEGGRILVPEVDLTAALVLAEKPDLRERVAKEWHGLLPDYRGFTVEAAEGLWQKTQPIYEQVHATANVPPTAASLWDEAGESMGTVRALQQKGEIPRAADEARAALRALRALQHQVWKGAQADRLPHFRSWNDLHRLCFYDLPKHWEQQRRAASATRGPNLLPHGRLEDWKDGSPLGWEIQQYAKDGAAVEPIRGEAGVRLSSSRSMPRKAWWYDWLCVALDSPPVSVKPNVLYEVSALVLAASAFSETDRGAVMTVLADNAEGEAVWLPDERELQIAGGTQGWQRRRFVVHTTSEVSTLRVRLGLAGVGGTAFSDVSIRPLTE